MDPIMMLRRAWVDFHRFTKHIQHNVTQYSFLFNSALINLNIPSVSSVLSSRYEHLQEYKIDVRATSVIFFLFTSSVGHYKKGTFYFVKKKDVRGTKETNLSLHHALSDIHYVCKYIIFWYFISKVFQIKI